MTPIDVALRRLMLSSGMFLALMLVGTAGYGLLGHGHWSFLDCLYMTAITVFTVGFGELPGLASVPGARVFTLVLIVLGVGIFAFVQGALTAVLLEGMLGQALRRNRMKKRIANLRRHVVVAGAGQTGRHILEELCLTRTAFVVIDREFEHLERARKDLARDIPGFEIMYVHGDATEDEVLREAGVENASGVIAALTHDKDNLFVTLSARSLNPTARIIAKVTEADAAPKMMKAGASKVVNPTLIGGRRLASELIRPEVTEFLDIMMRDRERTVRIEELAIPEGSEWMGRTVGDLPIHEANSLLVIAGRHPDDRFEYNPPPNWRLTSGSVLVVMAEVHAIERARRLLSERAPAPPGPLP